MLKALVLVVMAAVIAHGWGGAPSPPVIAEEFRTEMAIETFVGMMKGKIIQQTPPEPMYFEFLSESQVGPYVMNATTHFRPEGMASVINHACRLMDSPYPSPMFDWVRFSRYDGEREWNGVECAAWKLAVPGTNITVCVDENSTPLVMRVESEDVVANQIAYFLSFEPGSHPVPPIPRTCSARARDYLCADGAIEEVEMIRFHAAGDYTLNDKNTADLIGDTAFICMSTGLDVRPESSAISKFIMHTNSSWGQYGFCNDGACMGGNDWSVGREATAGILEYNGQCANVSNLGAWYSLRSGARCNSDDPLPLLHEGKCAWEVKELVKTVSLQCLVEDHQLLELCANDAELPYASAAEALQRAFASEDPAKGGCPDVAPAHAREMITQEQLQHRSRAAAVRRGHGQLPRPWQLPWMVEGL